MSVSSPRIRVALVGCGQIADAHLSQLQRIPAAEVVGVCDVHEDLAWQAAKRFKVPQTFTSHVKMLDAVRPDVVHITTPAHTHASLAIELLQAGCHVYVEKPFTLDVQEAREVLATARSTGRLVCVGHDQLLDPAWLTCRDWIRRGLIGEVRHVDSILGYPIDGRFGQLVKNNPGHWVRQLPGGLFQNTISHPLYRITDLITDDQPEMMGGWKTRPELGFPTELSLSLQGKKQSGSLTFSTFLPPQRHTRVFGSKGSILIDFDTQTLQLHRNTRLPGAFAKLEGAWQEFGNGVWNLGHNLLRFARSDIHYFAGMKNLFEAFYATIQMGSDHPTPPHEVERITLLMDRLFAYCRNQEFDAHLSENTDSCKQNQVAACL